MCKNYRRRQNSRNAMRSKTICFDFFQLVFKYTHALQKKVPGIYVFYSWKNHCFPFVKFAKTQRILVDFICI